MKRTLIVFLAIMIFVSFTFASCSEKNKEAETTTSAPETTLQVESEVNEKERTKKTVYRDSYGEICRVVIEKFDKSGNLLKQSSYTGKNKLEGIITYKYDKSGNIISTVVYDSAEDIQYQDKNYEYKKIKSGDKSEFLLLSYERYDSDDELQSVFKYEYDKDGNMTCMKTYSASGNLLTENKF